MDKIRDPIKIASLSTKMDSMLMLERLESMLIQIEQVTDDQDAEGITTNMRIISVREIVTSSSLTVLNEDSPNGSKPKRTYEEKAKMITSLMYLAIPELWHYDVKISSEVSKWNYGPPTWGQIKRLELWKLLKLKKTRAVGEISPNPQYANSFHRLYNLMKGLIHMDEHKEVKSKNLTWKWLSERADYEIIMILPL